MGGKFGSDSGRIQVDSGGSGKLVGFESGRIRVGIETGSALWELS